MQKRVILYNIRSAHNVGSIFRTADGAGVDTIYLSGYTPEPIDRFGRKQEEIFKTSLGASETVTWKPVTDIFEKITLLKKKGWRIVAVELDQRSVSLYEYETPPKAVYVFGNEIEGVDEKIRAAADCIVEIPMNGKKESLNVSVAAGIILFKL